MKVSISGVRGIFGSDLTLQHSLEFSRAFSNLLKDSSSLLARDTRPSSRIMSHVVGAGLMERGIDVHDLGVAPTPFVFREARRVGAGLIVTASHNPLDWNGLKFVLEGRGLFEPELQTLTSLLTQTDGHGNGKVGKESGISSSYVEELAALLGSAEGRPSVAVDPTGGAACGYVGTILSRIGCSVTQINDLHGASSRSPDPTTDQLSDLGDLVLRSRCDAGFAFDLDGDRLVVVDSRGRKMAPDTTMLLCVSRAMEMGAKEIVVSADTSDAVRELADASNCRVWHSKVGEANVIRVMQERQVTVGGEGSSGGFVMSSFNSCRDGMMASAMIAGMLGSRRYQECIEAALRYHLMRGKVPVESAFHPRIIEGITGSLKKECSSVDQLDGAKGIFDDRSWVLFRGSNTEECIRISVQAGDQERAGQLYRTWESKIREGYERAKRAGNN